LLRTEIVYKIYNKQINSNLTIYLHFLVKKKEESNLIGISADFDPVHLGHGYLIQKAREVADAKGKKWLYILTKDTVQTMLHSLLALKPGARWPWKPELTASYLLKDYTTD
jgi:citrate lyase synthetase